MGNQQPSYFGNRVEGSETTKRTSDDGQVGARIGWCATKSKLLDDIVRPQTERLRARQK